MPSFNRRGFLQLLGAAGVTPLLPALPARAAVTTAGFSTSKALWAGIHAKSGSVSKFVSVARNMGLSGSAIQGVGTRSIGVRVAAAAVANPLPNVASAGKASLPSAVSSPTERLKAARNILRDFERGLTSEAGEEEPAADHDAALEHSAPQSGDWPVRD